MGYPSVYPTGTTIYDLSKCWNGYTVYHAFERGNVLIDMNGNVVKLWDGAQGFPVKILPNGNIIGSSGRRNPEYGFMDQIDLLQLDWSGNVVWKFDRYELIEDPETEPIWMSRQHHDFHIKGFPLYFVPGSTVPDFKKGTMLILGHVNVVNPKIHKLQLIDDVIYEVDMASGRVVWEWKSSDHYDELGFDGIINNHYCLTAGIRIAI